jgi:hypothetical protein
LPVAGKTPGPRAIPGHRAQQRLKGPRVFKELPGRRDKLVPKARRGHKVLLEIKARRVKKGRRATRVILGKSIRATGARKVTRATQVPQFVSSKLTGK